MAKSACEALDRILPPKSKRTALEEALYEEDVATKSVSGEDDMGFGREMLLQSFQKLRVFRPRLLVYGPSGMGQRQIGAAMLQHLEGFHVQSMDLATLMGDSGRTPEAAAIQIFVEAKRHKPSVLYVPGLIHWANTLTDSVLSTIHGLLDELSQSDPILLLGIAEGPLSDLPPDVRSWFGLMRDNRVQVPSPSEGARREFFKPIFDNLARAPNAFPDALPRRKRKLEKLPIAPPQAPKEPSAAQLQQEAENDLLLLEHLKYRLGPVLNELRKKFKVFTKDVRVSWNSATVRNF